VNRYIFSLNAGLEIARGRFVAFCNNDMVVEDNFVEQALACFVSDDVFAACARVLDRNGIEQGTRTSGYWKHGLLFYQPLPHTDTSTDCFFAVGGQSFYRRDVLTAMGSIDELLWPMYHEDIELSYRAWKSGYRIVYAPGSVCHHLGGHTSRKVFTTTQLRSFVRQNELLMVWKDVTDPGMLLEHVVWLVPRLVMALVRWDPGTLIGFGNAVRRLPRALRAGGPCARSSRGPTGRFSPWSARKPSPAERRSGPAAPESLQALPDRRPELGLELRQDQGEHRPGHAHVTTDATMAATPVCAGGGGRGRAPPLRRPGPRARPDPGPDARTAPPGSRCSGTP